MEQKHLTESLEKAINDFYSEIESFLDKEHTEKDLKTPMRDLANQFIFGGYIHVAGTADGKKVDKKIYLNAIEFYYHECGPYTLKDNGKIKDYIMYHIPDPVLTKQKKKTSKLSYTDNWRMRKFPLGYMHAHESGMDITFEDPKLNMDRFRASILVREFVVIENDNFNLARYEDMPTHIYDELLIDLGIVSKSPLEVYWVDDTRGTVIELNPVQRENVATYDIKSDGTPVKNKECLDKREWRFERVNKLEGFIQWCHESQIFNSRNEHITNLENWLDGIRSNIPELPKHEHTIFDVCGYAHYENILSNLYAFFIDPQEKHGLGNLFLSSLLESLDLPSDFISDEISIRREYYTEDKNRVDIVITDNNAAIIIENKVRHKVDNDFDDYYKSVKLSKKQGVLLTLQRYKSVPEHFVNLTHSAWMRNIKLKLASDFAHVDNKYIMLLEDTIKNIDNMTNQQMDKEQIRFYLNNRKEINSLELIKEQFTNTVTSQFCQDEVAKSINNEFCLKKTPNGYCYYKLPNMNLMITVLYRPLWNHVNHGSRVDVYAEVQYKDGIDALDKHYEILSDKYANTDSFEFYKKTKLDKSNSFCHFAHLRVDLDAEELPKELNNIGDIVADKIKKSGIVEPLLELRELIQRD